jgi:hypothetical protein
MSMGKLLTACMFVGVAGAVALAQDQYRERLPILDTFEGTAANDSKPDLKTGFVATEAKWKATWAMVNPKQEPPRVNFATHFLLVLERDAADPNRALVSVLKDARGVVSMGVSWTCIAFQPSNRTTFHFYRVSREGVTGVERFDLARQKVVIEPLPR